MCAERNAVFAAVVAGQAHVRRDRGLRRCRLGAAVRRLPAGDVGVRAVAGGHLPPGRRAGRDDARRAAARAVRAVSHRSGLRRAGGTAQRGKSTLVNRLVGERVAAVSGRPQTTRRRSLGVVAGEEFQLVLVDLPGFQRPFDRLTERMQRSVDETLGDADAVVLVLNAPGGRWRRRPVRRPAGVRRGRAAMRDRAQQGRPAEARGDRRARSARQPSWAPFHALHPISALTGDGVGPLLDDLVACCRKGPAFFPPGVVSDQSVEQRIAEIIREATLSAPGRSCRTRSPWSSRRCCPRAAARPCVRATVLCETRSQKAILVGKGGEVVKAIGMAARPEIERLLDSPVISTFRSAPSRTGGATSRPSTAWAFRNLYQGCLAAPGGRRAGAGGYAASRPDELRIWRRRDMAPC